MDLVPVLIKLDVGSLFLHLLDKVEGFPVDDGRVMIFGPLDFFRIDIDPLHRRILGSHRQSIDGVSGILFIGEDVIYGVDRPSAFSLGARNTHCFQFLLYPLEALKPEHTS